MMYYLSVTKNNVEIVRRQVFTDYAAAIEFLSRYYRPSVPGSRATLPLVTEIVNGVFARSYGLLTRPESIYPSDPASDFRYHDAAKQSVAFSYDGSYKFLIESEFGIQDTDSLMKQYDQEE
jgi:hypothetical protein